MKVSIIIPVYNKIKYLERLLSQVREQTFRDYECLLIDDGSDDGSELICDKYASIDERFRVFHIPNGGVSKARNLGLDYARGEYITFIDSDDQLHLSFLETLYSCLSESNATFVIGNLKKVWEGSDNTVDLRLPYEGTYLIKELLPEFAKIQADLGIYGFCVAKMLKREIIKDLRFDPNIRLAEDLNFYLDVYPRVDTICFNTKPYYYYLQEAENSSMLSDDDEIDYFTQLLIQMKIMDFLKTKNFFDGENKAILIRRIYDYVFFCIFHSKIMNLYEISLAIKKLPLPRRNRCNNDGMLKKALLFFYEKNLHVVNILIMSVYRALRRCIRHF